VRSRERRCTGRDTDDRGTASLPRRGRSRSFTGAASATLAARDGPALSRCRPPITGVTRPARLLTLATTFADHQRATLDSLR
jgi:hypothetical protein